ncbi:MurR/RpiR family transcriptional regulator [Caenibacillus caldisaponilyticus]|uniref:MurR/RpiR family transcriptional regulator n=1 Tax=Caenibacillus caldisaponilyticus TaxID=1674942 RepID=UPI0009887627|nr:MurR/RpiR family transcriptional regulator [Caenibacillus caldisaponilyticus]
MKTSNFSISSEAYQSLSTAERYLIDYIYHNLDQIPSLSIVRLSEMASVSTATIVRTMKKIGYDGFTSFKQALKNVMADKTKFEIVEQADQEISQAILKNESEVINTIKMLNRGMIEDAIQKIRSAKKLYIFARGFSEMIASEMETKFQLIEKNCEMHNDPNIIRLISRRIREDELAIFVSLNGRTEELVDACKNLRMNNVSTITITANFDSPLARLSEMVFVGYKSPHSYFPEYEVRSRLPLQVISRILLDAYAIRTKSKRGI